MKEQRITWIKKKSIIAISETAFFYSEKYKNNENFKRHKALRNLQVTMCNF